MAKVTTLGETGLLLQRNKSRKVIEFWCLAGSALVAEDTCKAIRGAAVSSLATHLNAGTIEFLWLDNGEFYYGNEHPFASGASGDRDDYRGRHRPRTD